MKKICKSTEPPELTGFREEHPKATWEEFKNTGPATEIKSIVFHDQGHLCAFCETKLAADKTHHQRIEHFHPKSDDSNPNHNWTLDWDNMIGVCKGGSNQHNYPTPENLSCDAYKDHWLRIQEN